MDKKSTMLLTVIAVATLLVAVVGATFAYFSVYQQAENSGTTTVTGDVAKVGTVTLSGNGAVEQHITAAMMAESQKGTAVWTVPTQNIAIATLAGNGTEETYFCKFTLAVTNNGTLEMANPGATTATDGGFTVTVAENVDITPAAGSEAFVKGENMSPSAIKNGTYTVKFKMNAGEGVVANPTNLITLSGVVNNSTENQTSYFNDKTIDLKYVASDFSCDTADYPN